MNDTTGDVPPWGGGRRGSDAAPVRLDTLYAAMKHSGPYDPQPVAFERASPITVAGPCGTLTRFPFPPRRAGHPKDVASNMRRARCRRERTVPSAQPITCAASA